MNLQRHVENIGIELEHVGFQPIVCRVIGYLMLSEPSYQSFYQIQEFLRASKSAISYALNYLLNEDYIDVITFPGDRKRYFKMKIDSWIEIIKKRTFQITGSKQIFREIADIKAAANPELSRELRDIADLYANIEKMIENTIATWAENRNLSNFNVEFNKLINKSRKL